MATRIVFLIVAICLYEVFLSQSNFGSSQPGPIFVLGVAIGIVSQLLADLYMRAMR